MIDQQDTSHKSQTRGYPAKIFDLLQRKRKIYIDAIDCVNMGFAYTNEEFYDMCKKHFCNDDRMEMYAQFLLQDTSSMRHLCEDYRGEAWEKISARHRMERYDRYAKKMSLELANRLLAQAQITINDVGLLIVNQTSGTTLPSLPSYLLSMLGCSRNILTYNLGYMGCSAAIINFDMAERLMRNDPIIRHAMVLSVEIPSVMISDQPSKSIILGNVLFGDGCAGAILSRKKTAKSLFLIEAMQRIVYTSKLAIEVIKFDAGENYHEVYLSKKIPLVAPKALESNLACIIPKIISKFDVLKHVLRMKINWRKHVDFWAIHPGGKKILDGVKESLKLTDKQMSHSYGVLKNYGNMSSPSVLFVLKSILRNGLKKGDRTLAITFGSGFKCNSMSLIYQHKKGGSAQSGYRKAADIPRDMVRERRVTKAHELPASKAEQHPVS